MQTISDSLMKAVSKLDLIHSWETPLKVYQQIFEFRTNINSLIFQNQ